MTDEERLAAQAKIREKVAARAALARRKTAERKLVRWASIVGIDSVSLVQSMYDPDPHFSSRDIEADDEESNSH